jgi:GAF domain-containing protein/ActR/RegA family two-component response regulator
MHILILDDDEPFGHMLRAQLQRLEPRFEVLAVATADAARKAVRNATAPFDVFLLDQRLDGSDVDGITLMQELKNHSLNTDAIILTGYDDPDSGLRAFEAGANRYLTKPFDSRELVYILRALERERGIRVERTWYQILTEIASEVTTQASKGNLDELLDEARCQVSRLMNTFNFMVVLSDIETDALDFRRQFEEDQLINRHWRNANAGLSGQVIAHNRPHLIYDTRTYCQKHDIIHYGSPAKCWLGVPLRVEDRAVGTMVVQNYQDESAYDESHQRLLSKVADQVAGAIHMAYQLERKAEIERQVIALDNLIKVMPRLMQESEDNFWHAVLTTITHQDGNSFNRAALFWYNEAGTHMTGRMGIGYFCREEARKAWEMDRDANRGLTQYFDAPHLARLKPTPLQTKIVDWCLETDAPTGLCYQIWAHGKQFVGSSAELENCLPAKFLTPPDLLDGAQEYECALLPVKTESGVLGLLVIDNAFDGEPLRPGDLAKLERLLEQVVQVWRQSRETDQARQLGESYEEILKMSRQITAQAASRSLGESLKDLCFEAQALTQADCVVVYPYHPSRESYDIDLVRYIGLNRPQEFKSKIKEKPRQRGVTFTVSQSGTLVIPDVSRSDMFFAGRRLAEHDFMKREEIKALIGVPMRQAATGRPLGVIYFDYRSTQKFSEQDIIRAEHIATIGATAISYQRETQGRTAAEANETKRRQEMQLLSNIQAQALASDSDKKKVIRAVLQNTVELFGRATKVTFATLDWGTNNEETRKFRRDYSLNRVGNLQSNRVRIDKGPLGEAVQHGKSYFFENALIVPIQSGEKPIAALMIEKLSKSATFDSVEQEIIARLVTVAALSLDNIRVRDYLQAVSGTVGAISDIRGLEDTLRTVVRAARQVAPDIECVTLWYQDPEKGELVAGPQWGVLNEQHKRENAQTNRRVRAIMKRRKPIFVPVVEREPCLFGDFTRDENIASAAVFPLCFGRETQAFGVLFLNYRHSHEFSPMERTMFPILANVAAAAIHDARASELAERRRKRLETALAVATKADIPLDKDAVLRRVLASLRDEFQRVAKNETAPYIMLYDDRRKVLELPEVARDFYEPDKPEYRERVCLPLHGNGITCRTARHALDAGQIVIDNVRDVLLDDDYEEVNSKTRSELCAGIVIEKRLMGALGIFLKIIKDFEA